MPPPRSERGLTRGGILLAVVMIVLAVGAIALLAARPARVLGVDAGALAESVSSEVPRGDLPSCSQQAGDHWRCRLTLGDERTSQLTYRVETDEWGCWDAVGTGAGGPRRLSGCVWLADYVGLADGP